MSKVLVVDDEKNYRDYLASFLSREGHEVLTAAGGREAVALGTRFRPDVLVVDWMLKDQVHGLHVVEVLGAVRPDMATVLITGFPSRDLKEAAERAGIACFIEKPFEIETITAAVAEAAAAESVRNESAASLAVVEVGADQRIRFANETARAMFAETEGGADAERLDQVVEGGEDFDAAHACEAWVEVKPRATGRGVWYLRCQCPGSSSSSLWLLRRNGERTNVPLTEMLLGVEEPMAVRWPHDGRVLVIDDDELFRHIAVAILESSGASCYAVETGDEALRLLEHDAGFSVAVVDWAIPGTDTPSLLRDLQKARPELRLVGNSALDRRDEFAALGIERFVRKPWRPIDLIEQLRR